MYNIYIQKVGDDFIDDFAYVAYQGFKYRRDWKEEDYKIRFFEQIEDVPTSKEVVVVGWVEETRQYMQMRGITPPLPLHIPGELEGFLRRKTEVMTIGEFLQRTELPVFVKPHNTHKLFTGGVMGLESTRKSFAQYGEHTEVLISEVVDMVSEYRCFVRRGKLVGLKHYHGDFKRFPDVLMVEEMIRAYRFAPVAYTLDVAVLGSGDTVLVECNDIWSSATYGLDGDTYVGCLMDRWIQVFNLYNR